jgi:hypothetical protein
MRATAAKSKPWCHLYGDNCSVIKNIVLLSSILSCLTPLRAAEAPTAKIGKGPLQVKLYLPDTRSGFYRGTRFDWSGVISSLQFQGHDYYGPWFDKTDPSVHDFIYDGPQIVAGPCSATMGPVDEFNPLGWDDAKPGGTFIKIGIGALRKPDDGTAYDHYRLYEIADPGKWKFAKKKNSIGFIQTLSDKSSGYGYVYRKTVQLTDGKPEMVLQHSIKNTGSRAIRTSVYNHNFLVLDGKGPGPGVTISVPFQIQSTQPPNRDLAEIRGNQIVYLTMLKDRDTATTPLQGFSERIEDNRIRIENRELGAGMNIVADRPLESVGLWSIRSVVAMEPYISISIEPGREFTWKSTYEYYTLPAGK